MAAASEVAAVTVAAVTTEAMDVVTATEMAVIRRKVSSWRSAFCRCSWLTYTVHEGR